MDEENIKEKEVLLLNMYVVHLAAKFRWVVTPEMLEEFKVDLRRFILEYIPENLGDLDLVIFNEFKKLFNYFDEKKIEEYKLPEVNYFISEDDHTNILNKAIDLDKKGLI